MPRRRLKAGEKVLAPLHYNAAIEEMYRARLDALVEDMHRSLSYWIIAAYKEHLPHLARAEDPPSNGLLPETAGPTIAMDDVLPANALIRALKELTKRWQKNFDRGAVELAKYFAKSVAQRTDSQLASILRRAGFSVRFKMTPAMKDIAQATVQQNVSLIKSIPQEYLTDVEGMVMRSVQTGRDLGTLAKGLEQKYKVTKRRAALISRDQNNKATAAFHRARQIELGITKAKWMHSHAGKTPRPTHLANNGKTYDVQKGWYDPAVKAYIHPGELINCRCTSKSIIPGFS